MGHRPPASRWPKPSRMARPWAGRGGRDPVGAGLVPARRRALRAAVRADPGSQARRADGSFGNGRRCLPPPARAVERGRCDPAHETTGDIPGPFPSVVKEDIRCAELQRKGGLFFQDDFGTVRAREGVAPDRRRSRACGLAGRRAEWQLRKDGFACRVPLPTPRAPPFSSTQRAAPDRWQAGRSCAIPRSGHYRSAPARSGAADPLR